MLVATSTRLPLGLTTHLVRNNIPSGGAPRDLVCILGSSFFSQATSHATVALCDHTKDGLGRAQHGEPLQLRRRQSKTRLARPPSQPSKQARTLGRRRRTSARASAFPLPCWPLQIASANMPTWPACVRDGWWRCRRTGPAAAQTPPRSARLATAPERRASWATVYVFIFRLLVAKYDGERERGMSIRIALLGAETAVAMQDMASGGEAGRGASLRSVTRSLM